MWNLCGYFTILIVIEILRNQIPNMYILQSYRDTIQQIPSMDILQY